MEANKILRFIKPLLGFIIVFILVISIGTQLSFLFYFNPKLKDAAKDIDTILPHMIQDLELLKKTPAFLPTKRTKNSAEFFDEHLALYGGLYDQADEGLTPLGKKLGNIIRDHQNWQKEANGLENFQSDPRLNEIDTSWISDLAQFDYWDFSGQPIFAQAVSKISKTADVARIGLAANLPHPRFIDIQSLAKIHVIKGNANGHIGEALNETRHLANLLHSSGSSLISEMTAIAILNIEREWGKKLSADISSSIPKEVTDAYRRVTWGWLSATYLGWYKGLPQELESYFEPELGICGSAVEMSVRSPASFYWSLGREMPMAPNTVPYFNRSIALQKRIFERCNLGKLIPISHPVQQVEELQYVGRGDQINIYFPIIPRIFSMLAVSMAIPTKSVELYKE